MTAPINTSASNLVNPINPINQYIASLLSGAAYSTPTDIFTPASGLPSGWVDITGQLEASTGSSYLGTSTSSGATAATFQNEFRVFLNPTSNQIVFAFKGSSATSNWISDLNPLDQGYKAYESIVSAAQNYFNFLKKSNTYKNYTFFADGHSLGGGMAQSFALTNGINGYGQNSLPISSSFVANFNSVSSPQGATFSTALSNYRKNFTFDEVNVSGDIATNFYSLSNNLINGVYLDQNPRTLSSPYAALEFAELALATVVPGLQGMAAAALATGAYAHMLGNYNTLIQEQGNYGTSLQTPLTAELNAIAQAILNPSDSSAYPDLPSAIFNDVKDVTDSEVNGNSSLGLTLTDGATYNVVVSNPNDIPGTSNSLTTDGEANAVIVDANGNDSLSSTSANALLVDGSGNDTLNAGMGTTTLVGGLGNATLNGGGGNDTFVYIVSSAGSAANVTINDNYGSGAVYVVGETGAAETKLIGPGSGVQAIQSGQNIVWIGDDGTTYTFTAGTLPGLGALVINQGVLDSGQITINNFNLNQSETSVNGFLGIQFQEQNAIELSSPNASNPFASGNYAPSDVSSSVQGKSQGITVYTSAVSDSPQTVTLSMAGGDSSTFFLAYGTEIVNFSDGQATLTIPAGHSSVTAQVIYTGTSSTGQSVTFTSTTQTTGSNNTDSETPLSNSITLNFSGATSSTSGPTTINGVQTEIYYETLSAPSGTAANIGLTQEDPSQGALNNNDFYLLNLNGFQQYPVDPVSPIYRTGVPTFDLSIPNGQSSYTFGLAYTGDTSQAQSISVQTSAGTLSGSSINYGGTATTTLPLPTSQSISNQDFSGMLFQATQYVLDGNADSVSAGAGINLVFGSGNNKDNTISGGNGQDIILVGNGDNQIFGGAVTTATAAITQSSTATATNQKGDFIATGDGNNTIVGSNGNDLITVGTGQDLIVTGAGATTIIGGVESSGADLDWSCIQQSSSGNGGSVSATPVFDAYLQTAGYSAPAGYEGAVLNLNSGPTPLGTGSDTIFGGTGNDFFFLPNGNNFINAGGGNDYIQTSIGSSTIYGGTGNDTIFGGGGNNVIDAGSGNTFITGEGGNSTIYGGSGNDTIYSGDNPGVISPGGADWTSSQKGNVSIVGGTGDSDIFGAGGNDTLIGGSGNTTLNAGAGTEFLQGGSGTTLMYGGAGNDILMGGSGNTAMQAGSGTDQLFAGSGSTALYGGAGNDTLTGGTGNDTYEAGAGNVSIVAGSGNDSIDAGTGNETIDGGSGTDTIFGGSGSNIIYAGNGGTATSATYIKAGQGNTTIYGGTGVENIIAGSGSDVIYAGSGTETIFGGAGTSTYVIGSAANSVDIVDAGSGDTLQFGAGITIADISASETEYSNGVGYTFTLSQGGTVNVDLGSMTQATFADGSVATFSQLVSPTFTVGNATYSSVSATLPDSSQTANGDSTPLVSSAFMAFAEAQTDADSTAVQSLTLLGTGDLVGTGNNVDDVIQANSGIDTLVAGTADDTLIGGGASDDYVVSAGTGTVTTINNSTENDILNFGQGIGLGDLTVSASTGSNGASIITIQNSQGGSVVINGNFGQVVDQIGFSDGSSASLSQLLAPVTTGSSAASSAVSVVLPETVLNMTLTGTANISATANDLDNVITANSGNDTLIAGAANDTLIGGGGTASYVVNSGSGNVTIQNSGAADSLVFGTGIAEQDLSTSSAMVDGVNVTTIDYGQGNDITIEGGALNSVTFADGNTATLGQLLSPTFTLGNTTYSNVSTTLGAGIANLDLTGSANVIATANGLNDVIQSNFGNDTLVAGTGNDTLNGGYGATTYEIAAGNQVTTVNQSSFSDVLSFGVGVTLADLNLSTSINTDGSVVVTIQNSLGGTVVIDGILGQMLDQLNFADGSTASLGQLLAQQNPAVTAATSAVSVSLSETTLNMTLTGTANISATGNDLDDVITANSGNDTLIAGSAHDTLIGGGGVATYQINGEGGDATIQNSSSADTLAFGPGVSELSISASSTVVNGINVVTLTNQDGGTVTLDGGNLNNVSFADGNTATISELLASTYTIGTATFSTVDATAGTSITTLEMLGSANVIATANTLNDVVQANSGNDTLIAGSGNDTFIGGSGANVFDVGSGSLNIENTTAADTLSLGSGGLSAWSANSVTQYGLTAVTLTSSAGQVVELDGDANISYGADNAVSLNQFLTLIPTTGTIYNADGSYSATTSDGMGNSQTKNYSAAGTLTSGSWIDANGSYGQTTYNLDGSSNGIAFNADGTYSITNNDGQDDIVTQNYSATGTLLGDIWEHADGSSGTDTFNANGSSTGTTQYANGNYSTYTNDGTGDVFTNNYNSSGTLLGDAWTNSNGTSGSDLFDAQGNVTSTIVAVDGSSTVTTKDANGDTFVTFFNASGVKTSDSWTVSTGTYGSDTFNANGSSSGTAVNADGSYSSYVTDANGNTTTDQYNAANTLTEVDQVFANGNTVTTNSLTGATVSQLFNADGSYSVITNDAHGDITTDNYSSTQVITSDSWQKSDGSTGQDVFNANGSSSGSTLYANGTSSKYTNDGSGDVTTQNFNSNGGLVSDAWTKSSGQTGTDTFNPDGSGTGVVNNPNGSYIDTTFNSAGVIQSSNEYSSTGVLLSSTTGTVTTQTAPGNSSIADFLADGVYSTTSIGANGEGVITFYNANNQVTGSTSYSIPTVAELAAGLGGGYGSPLVGQYNIGLQTGFNDGTQVGFNIGLDDFDAQAATDGQEETGNVGLVLNNFYATDPAGSVQNSVQENWNLPSTPDEGNFVSSVEETANGQPLLPTYSTDYSTVQNTTYATKLVPVTQAGQAGGGTVEIGGVVYIIESIPTTTTTVVASQVENPLPVETNYSIVTSYSDAVDKQTFVNSKLVSDVTTWSDGEQSTSTYSSNGSLVSNVTQYTGGVTSIENASTNWNTNFYNSNGQLIGYNPAPIGGVAANAYDGSSISTGYEFSTPYGDVIGGAPVDELGDQWLNGRGTGTPVPGADYYDPSTPEGQAAYTFDFTTNDGKGDITSYDYVYNVLNMTWTDADGTTGTGTFNLLTNAGTETVNYADSNYSTATNDGQGDFVVNNYSAAGLLLSSEWGNASGLEGSENYTQVQTLSDNGVAMNLTGNSGADTFNVTNVGTTVNELINGNSTIQTSVSFVMPSNVQNLTGTGAANIALSGGVQNGETITANSGNDTLTAGTGLATLNGGTGNDTFVINSAADIVNAVAGANINTIQTAVSLVAGTNIKNLTGLGSAAITLTGNTLTNIITANSGADTLVAGTGNATLVGGTGNDTFVIDSRNDVVSEATNVGNNTEQTSVSATLAANVQNLIGLGSAALTLTGNTLSNTITANSGNDTLISGAAVSSLIGGAGNDTFEIDNIDDVITEAVNTGTNLEEAWVNATLAANVQNLTGLGSGSIELTGNALNNIITANNGADLLIGGAGNDTLIAGSGKDTLEAGTGVDKLIGGAGNDTFIINNVADTITDASTSTINSEQTSVSTTLANNVQSLVATGTAALTLTGNSLAANTITGNSGADTLIAGSGNDTLISGAAVTSMVGGGGNDMFEIDNSSDVITEAANTGNNLEESWVSATLAANVQNLTGLGSGSIGLTGNSLNNVITANNGADLLTGGSGNDTLVAGGGKDTLVAGTGIDSLVGGSGNDLFEINNVADTITDTSTTAVNSEQTTVSTTLANNVQSLTATGSAAVTLTGNSLAANTITGNSGADTLIAGSGNDTLISGAAVTSMVGGAGNDIFEIDNSSDVISESANTGNNLEESWVSATLAANVQNFTGLGSGSISLTGNNLNNVITANSGADLLTAGSGNDTLISGTGVDTLVGSSGNDTFVVNNASDHLTASSSAVLNTVDTTVNFTASANVQDLIVTGTGAITATGNSTSDLIVGGSGNDSLVAGTGAAVIEAGSGATTLKDAASANAMIAGTGNDTITGGAGASFVAAGTGTDTITLGAGIAVVADNSGDGAITIAPGTGTVNTDDNTLSLGGGIAYANLTFTKSGNNLILNTGGSNSITFTNWYAGAAGDQSFVTLQVIEQAASTYSSSSSNTLYSSEIETFSLTQLVSQFNAAGQTSGWSLMNDLLTDHLSSSNTAAIGGDLGYYDGLNGNLTGMNLATAISTLQNASFGKSAQTMDAWSGISTSNNKLH